MEQAIIDQVKQLFATLEHSYKLRAEVVPNHPNRAELADLIEGTASCSDKVEALIVPGSDLSLTLERDGQPLGICFRAVPGGHEYSSLLLAILNADGKGRNLPDKATACRIKALKGPAELTTFMSLSCTNCPDVVQALNVVSLLNPSIRHTAVDGALAADEAERRGVQAIPTVFLGEETISTGRSSLGELLNKLEEKLGSNPAETDPIVKEFDVVVAGAGPAGAAAAIYSARKGLKVAVVAGRVGGQVNETVGIENLISVAHTTGAELASSISHHMADYDIDLFDNRTIESATIDPVSGLKELRANGGETFRAPALIVATGASWRKLGVEGDELYTGRGIAFCPHCDGPFYKGKRVAVVGGGNSGVEAAIDLAGICSHVTVLEFMDQLKADTVLQEKLRSLPNVEVLTSRQTTEAIGDGKRLTALRVKNRQTEEETEMPFDGVFVQIGLKANSAPFQGIVETNRIGEIVTTDRNCRTAVAGVYAAGDVSDVSYKQIIISMGEGAKAALAAFDDKIRGKLGQNQ